MRKRNYTQVQALLPEIKVMLSEGKTQREVAEHFGFKDKYVVKQLLIRERRKERKLAAGIVPRPKGRPKKTAAPKDIVAEQAYEIQRLQMENKLLRDFLHCTGRKWVQGQNTMLYIVTGQSIPWQSCASSLPYPEAATTPLSVALVSRKRMQLLQK